ncbi:hypothetical protein FRC07_010195 [Ceratobasidium sp. 392]|nr:hypothetical protein FRC07_010195 [Ceratobasidium sp. 392]
MAAARKLHDRSSSLLPRKRQALGVASDVQRAKQVSARRKGKLSGMLSLPVEVVTEIATHLTPPDPIILSRLTKRFRALLMRRSATPIWASVIRNVPGLPACPDDLCEPQYAALVYSKHCSACGARVTRQMDPFLNVRLCNSCRAERVVSVEEAPNEIVKTLVPQRIDDDSGPMCLKSDLEELASFEFHLSAVDDSVHPDDEAWIQTKSDFRIARRKYARKLESFLERMVESRSKELETLKSQRRNDIKRRLESVGWSKRDWVFPSEIVEKWAKLVEAPKVLTDWAWESLYPRFTPYLEANRKSHLERAPEDRYRRRERRLRALLVGIREKDVVLKVERSVIKAQAGESNATDDMASFSDSDQDECESEDDWSHAHTNAPSVFALRRPFPPTVDVFDFPAVLPLVENDGEADTVEALFEETRDDIEEAILTWRSKVEGELLEVFPAGVNNTPRSSLALNFPLPAKYANALSDLSPSLRTLLRADTVFRIDDDRACPPPLYYPELFCIYQDYRKGHFPIRGGITPKLGIPWKTSYVRRFEEGVTAAKAILDELGRQDAAQFELQCLGAIFSCGQCSDKRPRTWNQIVHHHAKALSRAQAYERCTDPVKPSIVYNDLHTVGSTSRPRGKAKPLTIVHTPEAAKALMPKPKDVQSVVRCNLCSQLGVWFVGTRPVVLKHAKAVHLVVNPKANVYSAADQEDPDWNYVPRYWDRVTNSSGETDTPKGDDLPYNVKYLGAGGYWADSKHRPTRGRW